MACRESRGSRILLCVGLLVVASSFCRCTRRTKLKALDKLRGNSTLSKGQLKGRDVRHGRLLIGQTSRQGGELRGTEATENFLDVEADYQADMAGWGEPKQPQPQGYVFSKPSINPDSVAVERLLKMDPKVECTEDSMKLQVQDPAGSLFFVDRGSHLSPLPLSKLPPSCGYTVRSTMRDLVMVAPYDGCFVSLQEDCYVLPLRWCGVPVKMSCPLMKPSSPNPPMVTCHDQGMVVKTGWTVSVAKINVNLTGNWEPLMKATPRCGFSVVAHPEGVVISVRYAPCLEKKDGMYTLQLAGEGEAIISCPSLSPAQPEHPKPTTGPKLPTETPKKEVYPSTPSPINHNKTPQVPNFPKNPEVPKMPNLRPYYPHFFYPYPANPDTKPTTTVQPSQKTAPPTKQTVTPKGQVQHPFFPLPVYPVKPTAAPRPPQPEAPWSKVQKPSYPFYFYPQPEKPTNAPSPPQPEAPQPEPEKPSAAPRPPQPAAPWGPVQQPYYPFHFYPQPERPSAAPRPPQPEAPQPEPEKPTAAPRPPQREVPQPEPERPNAAPRPPQPVAPWGHVQQPYYPFHFYPRPEKPTAAPRPPQPEVPQPEPEKPTAGPRPPQPEVPQPEPEMPTAAPRPPQPVAPWGPVQQPYYPFHFNPRPEKPAVAPRPLQPEVPQPEPEKPTAAPRPPQPVAPWGPVQQPYYPYHFYPRPKKPTAAPRPPQPEVPQPEPEKPTAAPRPLQPVAPWGPVQQPYYPYHFYPQPEKPTAAPRPPQPEVPQPEPEKPTAAPRPPQPEVPQPEPEKPTAAPRPLQPVAPWGPVQQPYYPFHFNPQPKKPTAAPRPPQPEAPQPEPEKPTAAPRPPQPVAPWGPVQQPYYPYHFYPQPERPTAAPRPPQPEVPQPEPEKPTAAPRPPQPEVPQPEPEMPTAAPRPQQPVAPWGHLQWPFYPFHFYPQPEKPTAPPRPPQPEMPQPVPENPTAAPRPPQPEAPQPEPENPTAAPRPPQPEVPQPEPENPTAAPRPPQPVAPWGHVQQPYYPFQVYYQPEPEKPTTVPKPPATTEKPVQSEQLPPVKPPEGQIYRPQHPQSVPLPPAMQYPQIIITQGGDQDSQEPAIPQPSNGGMVLQPPQPGSPYMQPVYCPQICPTGFSNCCPQIAFHQHLHQIIPAGLASQDAPLLNPGLPFLPSLAYSGYGNGLGAALLPQKPAEATTEPTTTSTSEPTSSQSLPPENMWPYLQPPDGTPAVLHNPSKTTNPEQPTYSNIVPNSLYSNWPFAPQSQSAAHHNVPSNPQASGNEPVNPVLPYQPYNVQPWNQQSVHLSAGDVNNPTGPNFVSHIGQYLQQMAKLQSAPSAKDLQPPNNDASDSEGQPETQSELERFLVPYYMLQDAQVQTSDKSMSPNNTSQPQQFVSDSKTSTNHDPTVHSYSEPKGYVLLQHGPPGREPNTFSDSPLPVRDLLRDPNFFAQNVERHHGSKSQPLQNLMPPQDKPKHPKRLSYFLPDANYVPRPGDKVRRLPEADSVQRVQPHVPGNAFQQRSAAVDHQANGMNQPI